MIIKRIAGGMAVEVESKGTRHVGRTLEEAVRLALPDLPLNADQWEIWDALDSLLEEPPTQIREGIECS